MIILRSNGSFCEINSILFIVSFSKKWTIKNKCFLWLAYYVINLCSLFVSLVSLNITLFSLFTSPFRFFELVAFPLFLEYILVGFFGTLYLTQNYLHHLHFNTVTSLSLIPGSLFVIITVSKEWSFTPSFSPFLDVKVKIISKIGR